MTILHVVRTTPSDVKRTIMELHNITETPQAENPWCDLASCQRRIGTCFLSLIMSQSCYAVSSFDGDWFVSRSSPTRLFQTKRRAIATRAK
jgi:hypothetical protein